MRLYVIVFLIWSVDNRAGALDISGAIKKAFSDMLNLNCRFFADFVVRYPIKDPRIEEIGLELRTPCNASIKVAMTHAGSLKDLPEFNVTKKTVVFVTGWITGLSQTYIQDMAKAYHCRDEHNFLVFDSGGFIINEYFNSAYHTEELGEFLAVGLAALPTPSENIHIVGHSLGAHIVGSAGRHFRKLTGKNLTRITGLDPARPCFIQPEVFPRLRGGDADFVDVIHSNPFDLGTEEVIGDVDFFVEGLDVIKPGCGNLSVRCSHENVIRYYLQSVYPGNENIFICTQCSNYAALERKQCSGSEATMGYVANSNAKGIYYVPVKAKPPYGIGAKDNTDLTQNKCGLCQNSLAFK